MTVILVIVSLVFGSYLYEPDWFSYDSYVHMSSHESLEECQLVKHGDDNSICAGGELYVKEEE